MADSRQRPRRKGSWPTAVKALPAAVLAALGGGPERARLSLLWSHWEMVLGPELAPVALPLGHYKDVLLLGAEDGMVMQELHLQSAEILERVNAFMEMPFFQGIKVSLVLGKAVLDRETGPLRPHGFGCAGPEGEHITGLEAERGPAPAGIFLQNMDPASAAARCYARFAKQALPQSEK